MSPKDFITALFQKWEKGDSSDFFGALAEDVVWTAIGHTPISGTFPSKAEYMKNTYLPLQSVFAGKTSCKVKRIIAEEAVVAVEWHGETPLANGGIYKNDYCWVVRVAQEKLIEVVGYLDTASVNALFV